MTNRQSSYPTYLIKEEWLKIKDYFKVSYSKRGRQPIPKYTF